VSSYIENAVYLPLIMKSTTDHEKYGISLALKLVYGMNYL